MFRESSGCNRESWEIPKHFLRSEVLWTGRVANWLKGRVLLEYELLASWIIGNEFTSYQLLFSWNTDYEIFVLNSVVFFPLFSSVVWINMRSKPGVSPLWKRQGAAVMEEANIRNTWAELGGLHLFKPNQLLKPQFRAVPGEFGHQHQLFWPSKYSQHQ